MKTLTLSKIIRLLVCLMGCFIAVLWISDRLRIAKNAAMDMKARGRLAQLELMLQIYHDQHGAFPPTKYQRKAGEPVHSWRVLLLPHSSRGHTEYYSNYDFSQPWNSTNNLQVLAQVPYARPYRMGDDGDTTHFITIGEGEEWPTRKPLRSLLVIKGKDRFLLVEYPDSDIHWMEPKY